MRKLDDLVKTISRLYLLILVSACTAGVAVLNAQQPLQVGIHWDKVTAVSKTTPTLQVVVNPPLRHGEPLSAGAYKAVKELGADYVRYVPWLPYPRLAVAELEPPTTQKTSWDFSLIDPMTKDFLAATEGHPAIVNFSTIPAWLFKTEKPVTYPADPNQVVWNYTQGTELRDPTRHGSSGITTRGWSVGTSTGDSAMRTACGTNPAITTSWLGGRCSMRSKPSTT